MEKYITSQRTDLKWERLRLQYLRKCRRTLYTELLATDKLNEHLGEINEQADSMLFPTCKATCRAARHNGSAESRKSVALGAADEQCAECGCRDCAE